MSERLEDVVLAALRGKELDVNAHRVTAPDEHNVSQYTSEEMDVVVEDRRSKVILDFLIEGEVARVSVNGLYKTSIPVSPTLIEEDSFRVTYTLEHSGNLPLSLIAVGENVFRSDKKAGTRNETEEEHSSSIVYAPIIPLAEAQGVVYLARLPDVAIVDRRMLRTMGIKDDKAARYITEAKEKGFSYYTHLEDGKYRRFVLVPKGAETRFHRDFVLAAERFEGIDLVSKQGLEAYLTNRNASLAPDIKLSEMVFEGITYYARAAVDCYTVSKEAKEKASAPRPTSAPAPVVLLKNVEYTLEQNGLVTLVKDVALLDRKELWTKTNIKGETYAGTVLRKQTEQNGYASYITHSRTGSLKRVTIVPKGTEERIYAGLKLDSFADLELIAKENVSAYAEGKEEIDAAKASVTTIKEKEYYLVSQIDEMIARASERVANLSGKPVDHSEKAGTKDKDPKKREEKIDPPSPAASGRAEKAIYQTETKTVAGIEMLVVKDVAIVDRELLVSQGFTDNQIRGSLYDAVRTKGFMQYESSGKRKHVLVPRQNVGTFRTKLTLEDAQFANIEFIARENASAYVGKYTFESNAELLEQVGKSPNMKLEGGKEYYLKSGIDAILKDVGIDISETRKKAKKKEGMDDAGSLDEIIDVHAYTPLGKVAKGVYSYEGRNVQLFTEETVVKYGDVFNKFTPEDVHGTGRFAFQGKMRNFILETTAAKDRRDAEGKPVPESEVGRGKKHYLLTEVANKCIMYLVDKGIVPVGATHGDKKGALGNREITLESYSK